MAVSRYLELVLGRRDTLSDEERAVLRGIPVERIAYQHGEVIIARGSAPPRSCLLVKGMATREHRIGDRPPVTSALHVPGDFVDLHAFLLREIDHDIVAQGDCLVENIDRQILVEISQSQQHLSRLLWLCTLIDAKLHRVWLATRARLNTADRVGHLMCELHARLTVVGLVEEGRFEFPLDQRGLALALGYSPVHLNRAVQGLRAARLLEWQRGHIHLPDPPRLAETVGFAADYLELSSRPR